MSNYSIKREIDQSFVDVTQKIREELKKEGFGVLTEIDVKDTLQKKIGVDFRNYIILGACNPELAYGMMTEEIDLGLLLPCNIIVYESENGSGTVVAAIDPVVMLDVTGRDDLLSIAEQVKEKLRRAIESV